MIDSFASVYKDILHDPANAEFIEKGYTPLYTAGAGAKIVIVGQAPGSRAQASGKAWSDASGVQLRTWLGVSDEQFYDPDCTSLLPMDFFYPGKAPGHGDLPPRKGFANRWHPRLLGLMPEVQLVLLIGSYAQQHYLEKRMKASLTETVRSYGEYLPKYFPLVHPSPLNFRWKAKNPWFEQDVIPEVRRVVRGILD